VNQPNPQALPKKLFVETTTVCNLSCAMCVKHAGDAPIASAHMRPEIFEGLTSIFPQLDCLILNGIGEPLLHPRIEEFIRTARRSMPEGSWVGFQSNGLLIDQGRAESLVEAGLGRICLSVDALSPEMFRQVREGGEVASVQQALSALVAARSARPESDLRIGVQFVLRRDNLEELPAVIDWAAGLGADFATVSHLMPYGPGQQDLVAYELNTDAAVGLYERWKRKGLDRGLDIDDYPRVAWSSNKAEGRQMLDLVDEMKAEARALDIYLNPRAIFARDAALTRLVEDLFAEASALASRLGLELKLPSVLPRQDRHCPFVEDSGVFVAWDGAVYPCYNLWHSYRCHIGDWEKPVDALCFGSLEKQDLESIWQSQPYRDFRRNVRQYDHPYCPSCHLAPCDYIQEQFEQDCFLKSEPCGSCLWAMGLLQCLQ